MDSAEHILNCLFCSIPTERIIAKNELVYAIRDGFPVTPMHSLIIPFRHVSDFFGLTFDELKASQDLIQQVKDELLTIDQTVNGFNIGMNCGESAGQTIFHCHIHLIPRRNGDVPNPRGGVRHIIPGKGLY